MTESVGELVRLADALYAGLPETFTEARNRAAKDAAAAGEKSLAADVKKLKKPSTAAWAVNLLVRREAEQIQSVLDLAESLRAAAEALDGDQLRALNRQRRQLTSALATSARSLAREAGVRLSEAAVDQVEGMLNAAMLDPVAAQVVRTGRMLTAFTSTGVSELDLEAVVAVHEALDVAATPVEGAAPAPVELHVVRDTGAALAAAEEAVTEAGGRVDEAEAELAEIEESIGALDARRLQLQGEADELRRRLAAIDDEADQVEEDREEAEEARADARAVLDEARQSQAMAERALVRLQSD